MMIAALHPCRDLIGRRQTSQSDSISPSDSPSSSSSSGAKLSPASEEALCFLYGLRDMDSQIRRSYAARHGQCATWTRTRPILLQSGRYDRRLPFLWRLICDFSDVAPNGELSQSIRGDIAMAVDWAEQVPSFHLLSPTLRVDGMARAGRNCFPMIPPKSLEKGLNPLLRPLLWKTANFVEWGVYS
ncbi:hypothetical protein COOONC_19467 [Cooperia oncophora]